MIPIVTATEAITSSHVAHGRRSARIPGISPCFSRGSWGRERLDFGGRGTPATATVRAARQSTVLFLAREYFERLLGAVPEIRSFFENLTEERLRQSERDSLSAEELLLQEDSLILL